MDTVPMQWTPDREVDCSGYTLPVMDTSYAALNIFSIAMFIKDTHELGYRPDWGGMAAAIVVLMGVAATSAVMGFCRAKECHDARDLREQWLEVGPIEREVLEEKWRDRRGLPPTAGGPD